MFTYSQHRTPRIPSFMESSLSRGKCLVADAPCFCVGFEIFLFLISLTVQSSKVQQCVSTPWPTSAWSSTDPLLIKRVPITSGWPTPERSPTLDPAR